MRAKTRELIKSVGKHKNLDDVANEFNPILQGWINYYAQYNKSELCLVFRHVNLVVTRWIMRKFKRRDRESAKRDVEKPAIATASRSEAIRGVKSLWAACCHSF
jgi:hypothetical protein